MTRTFDKYFPEAHFITTEKFSKVYLGYTWTEKTFFTYFKIKRSLNKLTKVTSFEIPLSDTILNGPQ